METPYLFKWLGTTFLALTFLTVPAITNDSTVAAADRRSGDERHSDRDNDNDEHGNRFNKDKRFRNRRHDDFWGRRTQLRRRHKNSKQWHDRDDRNRRHDNDRHNDHHRRQKHGRGHDHHDRD